MDRNARSVLAGLQDNLGTDVPVFKRPLGPEGDLYGPFAVSGHSGATSGILGEMDLTMRPSQLLIFGNPKGGPR